jgi:hypothetical protein
MPNFKIRQDLGKETMNGKDQESEFKEKVCNSIKYTVKYFK